MQPIQPKTSPAAPAQGASKYVATAFDVVVSRATSPIGVRPIFYDQHGAKLPAGAIPELRAVDPTALAAALAELETCPAIAGETPAQHDLRAATPWVVLCFGVVLA